MLVYRKYGTNIEVLYKRYLAYIELARCIVYIERAYRVKFDLFIQNFYTEVLYVSVQKVWNKYIGVLYSRYLSYIELARCIVKIERAYKVKFDFIYTEFLYRSFIY